MLIIPLVVVVGVVVVVVIVEVNFVLQLTSSLPSAQSLIASHFQRFGIQDPSPHSNSLVLQLAPGTEHKLN